MVIREPIKINPTMKMDSSGENAIPFRECKAVIIGIEDVETKFGKKPKAVLECDGVSFDVFLNNFSIEKLTDAFEKDDVNWIGKVVETKKQTDQKYGKECIVLHPVE